MSQSLQVSIIRRRKSSPGKFSYWLSVPQEIGEQLFSEDKPVLYRATIVGEKSLLFQELTSKGD